MHEPARQIYIVSDLHMGGEAGDPNVAGDRGFRMFTQTDLLAEFVSRLGQKNNVELVINGDFVDFLAEKLDGATGWHSFIDDQEKARVALRNIADREERVFAALRTFLKKGHRLVLLLGNHDIELCLPRVREQLRGILEADGKDFLFLHDGEAYTVGDALIEHGNRYDRMNIVDLDGLRQLRSLVSRRQRPRAAFRPPPGSEIVAEVVNPLKLKFGFVDLLKPQDRALYPILLALEPRFWDKLSALDNLARGLFHGHDEQCRPKRAGEIAAIDRPADTGGSIGEIAAEEDQARLHGLRGTLEETLGPEEATEFLELLDRLQEEPAAALPGEIAGPRDWWEGFRRWLSKDPLEKRAPLLLKALRGLGKDVSFDPAVVSSDSPYFRCARCFAREGWRHVVFGHTHMAKKIELKPAGKYLNSGTWTDLMRFPTHFLTMEKEQALEEVVRLARKLESGDWTEFTAFNPTYVRIDLRADGSVIDSHLCSYASDEPIP